MAAAAVVMVRRVRTFNVLTIDSPDFDVAIIKLHCC